jgi:prepilin signal peptidase PulO-like enzyme (type II secretory pathway)
MEGLALTSGGIFRPGMRAYFIPFSAGVALAVSAFLPWVVVDGVGRRGVPDVTGLWIAGLGMLSSVLAVLSLITRKNSRHPLLVVGLMALGIMILAWRVMPRLASEQALMMSQASAIVENTPITSPPTTLVGSGIYLGLVSSAIVVGFGLTIVVRRVATPYVVAEPDDDV